MQLQGYIPPGFIFCSFHSELNIYNTLERLLIHGQPAGELNKLVHIRLWFFFGTGCGVTGVPLACMQGDTYRELLHTYLAEFMWRQRFGYDSVGLLFV